MEPTRHEMEPEPPVIEYAPVRPAPGRARRVSPSVVSLVLVALTPTLVCACGYLISITFVLTLPAFILAVYGWITNQNRNPLWRGFLMAVAVLSTMVFLRNLADVLWFGHEALLAR